MLLVINAYLWKSVGCFVLLAGVYYAFSQRTRILSQIYSWLTYFFSVPPAADQQSTWPGEENWPLDNDSKGAQASETLTGIGQPNIDKQAEGNEQRTKVLRHFLLKKFMSYKRFLSAKRGISTKR